MVSLMSRVKRVLASHFNGAEVTLKRYTPGTRIGGQLVWDGFEGEMQIDRQVQLRRALRDGLTPEEQAQVSFILTLTPHEAASLAETH